MYILKKLKTEHVLYASMLNKHDCTLYNTGSFRTDRNLGIIGICIQLGMVFHSSELTVHCQSIGKKQIKNFLCFIRHWNDSGRSIFLSVCTGKYDDEKYIKAKAAPKPPFTFYDCILLLQRSIFQSCNKEIIEFLN